MLTISRPCFCVRLLQLVRSLAIIFMPFLCALLPLPQTTRSPLPLPILSCSWLSHLGVQLQGRKKRSVGVNLLGTRMGHKQTH